jgi:hypothetical protein
LSRSLILTRLAYWRRRVESFSRSPKINPGEENLPRFKSRPKISNE